MKHRLVLPLLALALSVGLASPALGLANRVFVSQRSGNNANSCDNIATPCLTFAGAVVQLNPGGEVIVLDSGGYGPVTITQAVTIEAPAGVTAFIHPPSGDAITINAGPFDVVTLRGLTLNAGAGNGVTVNSIGQLQVENCFIKGFQSGIAMVTTAAGTVSSLNVKGTSIAQCTYGIKIANTAGRVQASIDRCHLDGNAIAGFFAGTTSPGDSLTSASNTTANNDLFGWICGSATSGRDELNLEACTGSNSGGAGLSANSSNGASVVRYSNCQFSDNASYGVQLVGAGAAFTRGNNTITGNFSGPTNVGIPTFSPM